MNAKQRKALSALSDRIEAQAEDLTTTHQNLDEDSDLVLARLGTKAVIDALDVIHSEIETITAEEQEKLDNMSENAQEGDKGQALAEVIETLENAMECIVGAIDCLNDANDDASTTCEQYIAMLEDAIDPHLAEVQEHLGNVTNT